MLPILLAAAAILTTPTIQFTNDSVYTSENILSYEIVEHYSTDEESILLSKDLILTENHLLGYTIYDIPDTDYIDGLRFDGQHVYNWQIKNFDDTVAHTIQIKTVYTDDVAGMLLAAKNGDWSKLLSNPVMIFQIIYYILAALTLVVGGFGLVKSKKQKVKTSTEIAESVTQAAGSAGNRLIETALALITPLFEKLKSQNEDIIKALIIAKSDKLNDTIALLDLLKNAHSTEDIVALVERIKQEVAEADAKSTAAKQEAIEVINNIADGEYKTTEDDGTSI
jgi:hypothetical protein